MLFAEFHVCNELKMTYEKCSIKAWNNLSQWERVHWLAYFEIQGKEAEALRNKPVETKPGEPKPAPR